MSTVFYLLSALGGYLLTSALLLKFPGLLHRRKRHRFRCRHISHRGGAGENLENTMAAFRQPFSLLELGLSSLMKIRTRGGHDSSLPVSQGLPPRRGSQAILQSAGREDKKQRMETHQGEKQPGSKEKLPDRENN